MANILIVDDELGIRALLSDILSDEGHSVELAENAAQARAIREKNQPDLVLLDIWMPDVDGITLLKEWGANGQLSMPVIMMSGHGTIDTAVEATKVGACAFLEKPITMQKLLKSIESALVKPAPVESLIPKRNHLSPSVSHGHMANPQPLSATAAYNNAVHAQILSSLHDVTSASTPSQMGHASVGHSPYYSSSTQSTEQVFSLDRPLREARDDFERAYFEFHLSREGGSMTRVSEKTGLERTHLYRKLKQLGVDLTRNRKTAAH